VVSRPTSVHVPALALIVWYPQNWGTPDQSGHWITEGRHVLSLNRSKVEIYPIVTTHGFWSSNRSLGFQRLAGAHEPGRVRCEPILIESNKYQRSLDVNCKAMSRESALQFLFGIPWRRNDVYGITISKVSALQFLFGSPWRRNKVWHHHQQGKCSSTLKFLYGITISLHQFVCFAKTVEIWIRSFDAVLFHQIM
jgi:hypothetical protein